MHQIEQELKWAIDQAGHARLLAALPRSLGPGTHLIQRNRFYDTADRALRRAGMNVRLRHENDRLVLTVKRRLAGDGPGLGRHEEWEHDLHTMRLADIPESGAVDAAWWAALPLPEPARTALADAPIIALGGFANERHEFHRGDEVVCLDATTFSDRIDHELEVETPDAAASTAWWRATLTELAVPWERQPMSKFARYVATIAG
jgi:uncharacterized protein YjbK